MSYPGPPASSDFPWIDAGGPVPAADTYGTLLPASFRRRRGLLVRNPVGNRSPGAVFSPEGQFPQRSRTRVPFRRRFLSGGRIPAADTYGTLLPASFRRRRGLLVRNPVGNRSPGAVFSPEGQFPQRSRTRVPFRRRFLSGGRIPAADTYGTLLPASFRRRRGLLVRNPVGNPPSVDVIPAPAVEKASPSMCCVCRSMLPVAQILRQT